MKKKLVIFDIDNTLTESRTPLDLRTAKLLCRLLEVSKVAVISGASFEQFIFQVVSRIPCKKKLSNLYLLPTTGATMYRCNETSWIKEYSHTLSPKDKNMITDALCRVLNVSEAQLAIFIEDRGTQITYSGLGKDAPTEEKRHWDPTREKRLELVSKLRPHISNIHMALGGTTSIDFTQKGIDKAYGVDALLKHLNISVEDAVFIGDALYEGGNDAPVKKLGIKTISTIGPAETQDIIHRFI
jgi:HAD superfamily hydrolase (TIGR01484 family)